MKGYTNKDFNLGMTKTLVLGGSRAALFVPRLLGKISEKLILSPITELTTGISHEETKQAAIDIVTQVQNNQAAEMQPQIDAGTKKVENWARDERGNVQDHFWYRANKTKLDRLVSKQARLKEAPRRIMVAAAYVQLMKENGKKYTEQLKQEYEAEMRQRRMEEIDTRIDSIEQQLQQAEVLRTEMLNLQQERDQMLQAYPELAQSMQEEQSMTR